jgi:8-oxo-dGTP pyrophosphatase MutT (NUDIX family)
MKKNLTVVFPVFEKDGESFVLMGRQAPGKKLAGFRNGYGGKCFEAESMLDCAKRELEEELKPEENYNIKIDKREYKNIGSVFMDDKQIDFFVIFLNTMITPPSDNSEFVDTHWYDLKYPELFVGDMLSGDEAIIKELNKFLDSRENYVNFEINKTGDKKLEGQVKNIYK